MVRLSSEEDFVVFVGRDLRIMWHSDVKVGIDHSVIKCMLRIKIWLLLKVVGFFNYRIIIN